MKPLLYVAALGLIACQADTKNISDKLDRLEQLVKTKCGGAGGAAGGQRMAEREEPAPDATFAVDVKPNLGMGMVEGPSGACVTLVEAWDFA
jgi:hypothetical protein